MANCGQACPYNTLDGCKVKEYNAICPLANMATPITEYRMTNADRIRAMSDEELAEWLDSLRYGFGCELCEKVFRGCDENCRTHFMEWLKQPAEE